MAAPDLAAAQRAAEEIVAAGAGTVLLFGSLARGEAGEASDIDLVAIYDDLGDYSDRRSRRGRLEQRAQEAAGCPVDVYVTDAPEWAHRSRKVGCSLEACIAGDAVTLADSARHAEIDWDKEIGLPSDTAGELQHRFMDMSDAVDQLEANLLPSAREAAAAGSGFADGFASAEDRRFAAAMGAAHMAVECAAKAMHLAHVGTAPARSHSVVGLLAPQPDWIASAFETLAGDAVDLGSLHLWRQGATYSEDRPQTRFDEPILRSHAKAALDIAELAARQCRTQGISEEALAYWDWGLDRCRQALSAPLRHPAAHQFR